MPKDIKDRSLSSRTSPYPCSSRRAQPLEDVKEWEEARCPVCMEHPHNAVLLLCSSHEKGCRPYMCDTSYRHSNCLDQFRKVYGETSATLSQDVPQENTDSDLVLSGATNIDEEEVSNERTPPGPTLPCESQVELKLPCPLCRGQVNRWIIEEPARRFMNAKARSCASETCDFDGNYAELRKHARLKHPLVRPSEADPQRQNDWTRLERERDFGDVLSTIQSAFGEERANNNLVIPGGASQYSVLIFFRVSSSRTPSNESGGSNGSSTRSGASRPRSRRRTMVTTLWGENLGAESESNVTTTAATTTTTATATTTTAASTMVGDEENGAAEGIPIAGTWQLSELNRRWSTSDEES